MSGKADAKPYNNGDGKIAYVEPGRYLNKTLTTGTACTVLEARAVCTPDVPMVVAKRLLGALKGILRPSIF